MLSFYSGTQSLSSDTDGERRNMAMPSHAHVPDGLPLVKALSLQEEDHVSGFECCKDGGCQAFVRHSTRAPMFVGSQDACCSCSRVVAGIAVVQS